VSDPTGVVTRLCTRRRLEWTIRLPRSTFTGSPGCPLPTLPHSRGRVGRGGRATTAGGRRNNSSSRGVVAEPDQIPFLYHALILLSNSASCRVCATCYEGAPCDSGRRSAAPGPRSLRVLPASVPPRALQLPLPQGVRPHRQQLDGALQTSAARSCGSGRHATRRGSSYRRTSTSCQAGD